MDIINTISSTRLWNKHAVKIAWGISIACLLLILTSIVWSIWSQSKIKTENYKEQSVRPIKQSNKPPYRLNDIVSANLFGNPKPAVVVKQAPKTTLNLTLQGILSTSDVAMARAIILAGKQKSELYSVGEKIPGTGASVKEIRDNEVILNRNGALESLPLIKKNKSGDRSIITFNDPTFETDPTLASATSQQAVNNGDAVGSQIQQTAEKPRSQQGAGRKIRRPNFSGLDRALKKMGEL